MLTRILVLSTLVSSVALASPDGLVSPFPSTVPGLPIPNAHVVEKGKGTVLRGMSPLKYVDSLKSYGVTDVLIFKNATRSDVSDEVAQLRDAGYPNKSIHEIPFKWKELDSFQTVCEQTVQALDVLTHVYQSNGRSVFFHCTVGEDRTGYLAGLFRMLVEGWDTRKAFDREMCLNGYEAGDPHKPQEVDDAIRAELTPAWLKMAGLIQSGRLKLGQLDPKACAQAADADAAAASKFVCSASPLANKTR